MTENLRAEENRDGPPLPHDIAAEVGVVGVMLLEVNKYFELIDNKCIRPLTGFDFYDKRNAHIAAAILAVAKDKGESEVNPVTVAHYLRGADTEKGKASLLITAGGPEYIAGLAAHGEMHSTICNFASYAKLLQETADLRRLLLLLQQCGQSCYNTGNTPSIEIVAKAEAEIFALGTKLRGGGPKKELSEIAYGIVERLGFAIRNDNFSALDGTPTGYGPFDNLLSGGLRAGELTLLAARPSVGKTAFALDIAARIASREIPVAFLSLEMSCEQLTIRLMARESQVNTILTTRGRMGTSKLTADEMTRLASAAAEVRTWPLFMEDEGIDDLDKIVAKIRGKYRACAAEGKPLGLVVVDYLQLVRLPPAARRDIRAVEVGEVSRELKNLARELGVPILGLAQLNRQVESRDTKRPFLGDLRDSGSLEQDADNVFFLYRDGGKNNEPANLPEECLWLANEKARQGIAGGKKEIKFLKAIAKFDTLPGEY